VPSGTAAGRSVPLRIRALAYLICPFWDNGGFGARRRDLRGATQPTAKDVHMNHLNDDNYDPVAARRIRHRKQVVAGLGLAAVLGGGAIYATQTLTHGPDSIAPHAEGPAPMASVGSVSSGAVAPASRPPSSPAPAAGTSSPVAPSAPADPQSANERVAAARSAAAKDGIPVQRPVPQVTAAAVVPDLKVTNFGSLRRDRKTLRVVSGRGDLTGQRELAWVADDGVPVGDARCGQNFRFANHAKPARKPNLLLCWRTSADKSVFTVMVDVSGHPSKRDSVAALDKQWNRLG
jgi:hypothetical protein